MTHSTRCHDLAVTTVQEECDVQGIEWTVSDDQESLIVPAWNMTMDEVVAEWISNGTIACRCNDF